MDAKRGYVPEDDRNFSPGEIEKMRTASRYIAYLINEGYGLKQASTFVGNHYLFSERQRLALMRSLATKEQLTNRRNREISLTELAGQWVLVDGFNTIITMEVMLNDSILLTCMDGTVRDLASLRGTYRIIPETESAVRILFDTLKEAKVQKVTILLDEPVSNSGSLKALIAEVGEAYHFCLDIRILKAVDRELYAKDNVITSDSIILDNCNSWVNLMKRCMEKQGRAGIRVWEETWQLQ